MNNTNINSNRFSKYKNFAKAYSLEIKESGLYFLTFPLVSSQSPTYTDNAQTVTFLKDLLYSKTHLYLKLSNTLIAYDGRFDSKLRLETDGITFPPEMLTHNLIMSINVPTNATLFLTSYKQDAFTEKDYQSTNVYDLFGLSQKINIDKISEYVPSKDYMEYVSSINLTYLNSQFTSEYNNTSFGVLHNSMPNSYI